MALRLWLLRIYIPIQLEAFWMLIWIASVANGSTFIKNQPKNKDSTLVPDGQITDFNIVNSSLFTKPLARLEDYVIPGNKKIDFDEGEDEFDDDKIINSQAKQKHDNTTIPNNRDIFINPDVLFHQEKQNLGDENSKRNNFKSREQKHVSGYHFLMTNGTVIGSKIESKDPFNFILNNVTSLNRTQLDGQSELVNGSVNVLDVKKPLQSMLNKSVIDDKSIKTNLSDTALFNKYLIAERKKAASHYNSTLSLSKQKVIYHESAFNESSLMNDQPVQSNISDGTIKSTNDNDDDDEGNLELSDHDNITNIDEATNETIYNGSSSAIGRTMPANIGISFNTIVITSISLGVVVLGGIMAAGSYVIYRHRYWNKPQTLSDKCSNADSSGYIDDSTLRENSEEMYSLDNDSFLNSLEAMTIQNYWTDNVKHTKL